MYFVNVMYFQKVYPQYKFHVHMDMTKILGNINVSAKCDCKLTFNISEEI